MIMRLIEREFIAKYKDFALETQQKTGISHLFTLGQASLESGWGLHAPNNMFFGIKADRNCQEELRQLLVTTEVLSAPPRMGDFPEIISVRRRGDGKYNCTVKDWFRKYKSAEECFTDHAMFFFRYKRYAQALLVRDDPYKFADAIAAAGYATDPHYAEVLKKRIAIIDEKQ